MKSRIGSLLLVLCLLGLAVPAAAFGQNKSGAEYSKYIRRGKNGIRIGNRGLNLFDGPGILNYEYKHRWMPGPGGAATVIGIGAGGGAAAGGLTKGKKGAIIGALAGAGGATALWLYKNRTEKRKIF